MYDTVCWSFRGKKFEIDVLCPDCVLSGGESGEKGDIYVNRKKQFKKRGRCLIFQLNLLIRTEHLTC